MSDCFGIEPTWLCSGGSPTSVDICTPKCGDGVRIDNELCDDGSNNSEGCNSDCSGEQTGYSCTHPSGAPSVCIAICGDGLRVNAEVCDDDEENDLEGCGADCLSVLSTWSCSGGSPTTPDICSPICGDGIRVGPEICDDGLNDNFGCNSSCTGSL